VKEEDGIKKIFITSDNPHIIIDDVEGNILPEKTSLKDIWGWGFTVGPLMGYDLIKKDMTVGLGISVGWTYKRRW
jgi:hypothetical protein